MTVTPNYVPREYKTINVYLLVSDAEKALKFYNMAFGAEVTMKLVDPEGIIVHAEMRIEDTIIMLSQDASFTGTSGIMLQLYTGDVEKVFESALLAGAKEIEPIKNQFYGDRAGKIQDPFGHQWKLATRVEEVPPRELYKRFNELYH